MPENFRIGKKGGSDKTSLLRFIRIYISVTGPVIITAIVGAFSNPPIISFKHLAFFLLCAIPFCIFVTYLIEKIGGGLGNILSGWTSRKATREERFSCDINKIKYSKREGRFDQALQMVNNLLHQDPDFPEAMLLKAQILWEGQGKGDAAEKYLNRIREMTPKDDKFHRWATGYLEKVGKMAEKR